MNKLKINLKVKTSNNKDEYSEDNVLPLSNKIKEKEKYINNFEDTNLINKNYILKEKIKKFKNIIDNNELRYKNHIENLNKVNNRLRNQINKMKSEQEKYKEILLMDVLQQKINDIETDTELYNQTFHYYKDEICHLQYINKMQNKEINYLKNKIYEMNQFNILKGFIYNEYGDNVQKLLEELRKDSVIYIKKY